MAVVDRRSRSPQYVDTTGATLAGFRREDMLIPDVEDVVADVRTPRPHGTDPVNDQTMVLNMGPQHPSTHGVLRLVIEIDGETIVSLAPDIGYLHTGIEKTCEAKFYQQVIPLTDRIDYLCADDQQPRPTAWRSKSSSASRSPSAPSTSASCSTSSRASSRTSSGSAPTPWISARSPSSSTASASAKTLLRIFEAVSGQRMMTSYFRIGGLSLEPPAGLLRADPRLPQRSCPSKIDEYESLLTGNPIWMGRLKGVGYLSAEDAIALGVTGPPLRASGVDFDLRRDMPYSGYEKFQFNVPVSNDGDVWARYVVRMQEMRESVKICQQALDGMPEGRIVADAPKIILPDREQMKTQMESLIHHFKIVTEGFAVPAGEVYQARSKPRTAR